jgi:OmpA-OmpF porin, OOP family
MKPAGKATVLLLLAALLFFVYKQLGGSELIGKLVPQAATKASVVPTRADLPSASNSEGSGVAVAMPQSDPGCEDRPEVRMLGYAWNAQMGLLFANGGAQATRGSLMCKYGVNLHWERQDDNSKLQENLVAFATDLKNGNSNPDKGVHFVTIMGDGSAAFLAGLNETLAKIGPEYKAKVVGSAGFSRGEDKLMGPAEWKTNPSAARGAVCAGVLRDGDWNIAQKWLGDNGLRTNPDEKTYDPDALNWVAANDYIDAAQKYVTGYSEDRPVVRNGKRTGETKRITVDSVVTWTPGDVTIAKQKGGLVSIVSTKEYASQMPCIIIGIDKWMRTHAETVQNMLRAISEGGDAVKSSVDALKRASEISATVYHESGSDAAYWEKYYKGVIEPDKNGIPVDLGGSAVSNLADQLYTFGLSRGSSNLFAATYTVFGNVVKQQYPELMATVPDASSVYDTRYLAALSRTNAPNRTAIAKAAPTFSSGSVKRKVSSKSWNITFASGRAQFAGGATKTLDRLLQDLLIASGTVVEIHGHTDNVGSSDGNMALSEARAFAVKAYLEKKSPANFPAGRIRVFAHGQTQPIVPNTSPANQAKNRRVEITLGTTN